ncbi:MAG TPA: hypothetical protein VGI48_12635 [Caldimonas sp.]
MSIDPDASGWTQPTPQTSISSVPLAVLVAGPVSSGTASAGGGAGAAAGGDETIALSAGVGGS